MHVTEKKVVAKAIFVWAKLDSFPLMTPPRDVVEVVVNTNPFPFAILNIFVLRIVETPMIMRNC